MGDIVGNYKILKQLGQGTYGEVHTVQNIKGGPELCLKIQKFAGFDYQEYANNSTLREIDFLKKHQNPFFVRFVESFRLPNDEYHRNCLVFEIA